MTPNQTTSSDIIGAPLKAYLVGVQAPGMQQGEGAELLAELRELADTLGLAVVGSILAVLRAPAPEYMLGKGKFAEVVELAKASGAEVIVLDKALSPAQQRNWEEDSGMAVIDRQEVILEVFAGRARTREAMLQVELARREYDLPRLKRAWTHLSRQRGIGNLGGEGETQLEQDRRVIRDRITLLKRELSKVRKQRDVQRRKRQKAKMPACALVGYTNAGKSMLLNRLTGADVMVDAHVFATLDPTTRQMQLPENRILLVTDTVGFIRRLPHGLIEAFKATLEEATLSDFLIHVVDVTGSALDQRMKTTLDVLKELGAAQPVITVLNKADIASAAELETAKKLAPEALLVSAKTGAGVEELITRCSILSKAAGVVDMLVPPDRYDVVARLHKVGNVLSEELMEDGVHLTGSFPAEQSAIFLPFVIQPKTV